MNKSSIWVAIAMLIVCAVSIGYALSVAGTVPAQTTDEVRIVHVYTEGYNEGYSRGKAQGLEDAIKAYEYYG